MSIKTEKIWLDGELIRWEDAKVHVLSHALHYGTAYFEGIRCYHLADGRSAVFRLPEHTRRLADSGNRYQSKLFNPEFMRSKNLPVPAWLEKPPSGIELPFEKV